MPGPGARSGNSDAYTWIGANGALWSTQGDWADATAGGVPVLTQPGTATPVSIAGLTGSNSETVAGDGVAASVSVLANVTLTGTIAAGGALAVGSVVVTPGSTVTKTATLVLGGSAAVTAGSVAVATGTLSLAAGAGLTSQSSLIVGLPSGTDAPYNGSYIQTSGAAGAVNVGAGAGLNIAGDFAIASGALADAGGTVGVGGNLFVGTAATQPPALPQTNFAYGQATVTNGGTLAVSGAINDPGGIILVGGAGSRLIDNGVLVATGSAFTFYASGSNFGQFSGTLAAAFGGLAQVGGGIAILAPAVAAFSGQTPGLSVDATSTIEVGLVGGAAAGAITVDAGRQISLYTTANLFGRLVNHGTLSVLGGTTTQNGDVSGEGLVQIGTSSTLALAGNISAGGTVAFAGDGASLVVGSTNSLPYAIGATLAGFQVGDSIVLSQTVNALSYTVGQNGAAGSLVLSDNTGVIETLAVAGDFTGKAFFISPGSGGGASISLVNQSANANGQASANADAFRWVGSSGGSFSGAGNWADTTAGVNPVAQVPGAQTAATIQVSQAEVIAGNGQAASLLETGVVSLNGTIEVSGGVGVGLLSVTGGTPATSFAPGTLALSGAGRIDAGTLQVVDGALLLAASTVVSIAGGLTLGTASGANVPSGGSYVFTNSADGLASVGNGASLLVGGNVAIASGTLAVAGGIVGVAGAIGVGTAVTSTNSLPYTFPARGQVIVTAGGLVQIQGAAELSGSLLYADPNSRIEIGTAGGAAGGAITVDPGLSLVANGGGGGITGALVANGAVAVIGGALSVIGAVSGRGTLQIGQDGTLSVAGAVGVSRIFFTGTNASLAIGSDGSSPYAVSSSIIGFAGSDSIVLAQPLTRADFAPSSGNLTLFNGVSAVETLHLSGNYAGQTFQVTPTSGGGASVGLVDLQPAVGGASPYYLKSIVSGGQTLVQLWARAGTNVEQARATIQFGAAQASYAGVAAPTNWTSTVSYAGPGALAVTLADGSGTSAIGGASDAILASFGFAQAAGAGPLVVSATVSASTNSQSVALGAQSAGAVVTGEQVGLAGVAYDWKTHALLSGTQVIASGSGLPIDNGQAVLSFHNFHYDPSGNLLAELFADHVAGAQSFNLTVALPSGVASGFSASGALPSDWSVVANTGTPGMFAIAGMGSTGLSGAADIGQVAFSVPAGSTGLSLQVTADNVGGTSTAPFQLSYAAGGTDGNGSFSLAGLSPDQYAASLSRGVSDVGRAITAADALAALKLAVGLNPNPVSSATGRAPLVSPYQLIAADVNGDGRVTAFDAQNILRMSVGLASAPVAKWKFVSDSTSYWDPATNGFSITSGHVPTSLQASGGANMVGILTGDVNGSWVPLDGNGDPLSSYPKQPDASFAALSTASGAPPDQWGALSYSVAGAAAATGGGAAVGVLDSTANVAAGIDQLQNLASSGLLSGIWLTDASPTVLSVTGTQVSADAAAIALIHGNYTTPAGGTLSAANGSVASVLPSASAAVSFLAGPSVPELVVSGAPAMLDARNAGHVEGTLLGASVFEEVTGFVYGASSLGIDLAGLQASDLVATDVLIGGAHAVMLSQGPDLTHGVAILGLAAGQTAADLLANHTSFIGRYALIG